MDLLWILFGLLGWAVAIVLAFALMQMSGNQDRIANRAELKLRITSGNPTPDHGPAAGNDDRRSKSDLNTGIRSP